MFQVDPLNDAQRAFLLAAVQCYLEVQAEARRHQPLPYTDFCATLAAELNAVVSDQGFVDPLSHQEGAVLVELLAAGTLELRRPAGPNITPYYDDAPGGYAGQVPAEDEAWRVPVMLTVVGAETALQAGAAAGQFLHRATQDQAVNLDEGVQAFDVGYESAMPGEQGWLGAGG
jgi:hypothetical protein